MKIDSKELRAAVAHGKKGTRRNAGVAVLEGARLEVHPGGVEVYGSDLEVCSGRMVAAVGNGLAPVSIVSAGALASALQGAKGTAELTGGGADAVRLELDGRVLELSTLPADNYPLIPPADWTGEGFTVDAADYRRAVAAVIASASRDESRPVLTGIRFRIVPGSREGIGCRLELAATDSYRLHVASLDAAVSHDPMPATTRDPAGEQWIIPHRAVQAAAAMPEVKRAKNGSDVVFIKRAPDVGGSRWVHLGTATGYTGARLIDGQYPNVDKLLPSVGEWQWGELDGARLEGVLRSVVRMFGARAENLPVVLELAGGGGSLAVSKSVADAGTFGPVSVRIAGALQVQPLAPEWPVPPIGGGYRFGVNGRFLADALAGVAGADGGAVRFYVQSPMRPIMLEGAGGRALVMPIRLPS